MERENIWHRHPTAATIVAGVAVAVVLYLLVTSLMPGETQNATGEPYQRTATIVRAQKRFLKRWRYPVELDFDEPLPSGETRETTPEDETRFFEVCEGHEGERVLVSFDEKGFITEVELL